MTPTPSTQARPRGQQRQRTISPPWQCCAWLQGRLGRTKPDDSGKRRLVFSCTDGTRFEVAGIGNDVHDGGGSPVLHLLTYADRAFNTDGYWLTYPADRRGTPALTLALRSDMPRGEVDTLRFGASVKAIEDGTLTLFVGRRGRPGYHFLSLTLPSGLVLPELGYQCWVTGTATRNGSQWDLATIEAKPKAKNQRSPRPHRPTKVS